MRFADSLFVVAIIFNKVLFVLRTIGRFLRFAYAPRTPLCTLHGIVYIIAHL